MDACHLECLQAPRCPATTASMCMQMNQAVHTGSWACSKTKKTEPLDCEG